MYWLDLIGWFGSALLIVSVMRHACSASGC